MMDVINYLYGYQDSKRTVYKLQIEINAINDSLESVLVSGDFSDRDNVQISRDIGRRSELIAELADKKKELREAISNAEIKGLEIINTISRIPDPIGSAVLMYQYVDGLLDHEIVQKIGGFNVPGARFEAIKLLQKMIESGDVSLS